MQGLLTALTLSRSSIPYPKTRATQRDLWKRRSWTFSTRIMQVPVTRHLISTAQELADVLSQIAKVAEQADRWPLIHIESHGSIEGLRLAKGDFVRWADIQPTFLRLNKATRNHLFIVMAACHGFHGITSMLDRIEDAASFRLLCGPSEKLRAEASKMR